VAKPTCTFCDAEDGLLMDTNLNDGETQVVGPNCLLGYILGMAAAMIGGMSEDEAKTHAEVLDTIYSLDRKPPKPPARGGGRKPKTTVQPEIPLDEPQSDATATVELPDPCSQCGSKTATGDAEKLTCDGCGAVLASVDSSELSGAS
jgi:hypothetical protein